jgi:hypothetical protein
MPAPREPFEQPRLGCRQVRIGDADGLKTELTPPRLNALIQAH